MAAFVPDVTELSPSTWDATGIMAAIHTYISGTSTKFQIDSAHSTPDEGFLVSAVDAGETWQLSFRRPDNQYIYCGIDSGGDMTVGHTGAVPATGAGSDWSGEVGLSNGFGSIDTSKNATGSKLWVGEMDDCLVILTTESTNTYHEDCIMAGRVYVPYDANDTSISRDGLGVLAGEPYFTSSNGSYWLSDNHSVVHVDENEWGFAHYTGPPLTDVDLPNWKPVPWTTGVYKSGANGYSVYVGYYKYFRYSYVSKSPKTRLEGDTSNQAWMYISYAGADNYIVIPWKVGIVP